MSRNGSPFPEGQVSAGSGVWSGQVADGGLPDLSGLTLHDLRELRDAQHKSSLAQALSRVLAPEADAHYGFSSKI